MWTWEILIARTRSPLPKFPWQTGLPLAQTTAPACSLLEWPGLGRRKFLSTYLLRIAACYCLSQQPHHTCLAAGTRHSNSHLAFCLEHVLIVASPHNAQALYTTSHADRNISPIPASFPIRAYADVVGRTGDACELGRLEELLDFLLSLSIQRLRKGLEELGRAVCILCRIRSQQSRTHQSCSWNTPVC